jgi:hypothetical protein
MLRDLSASPHSRSRVTKVSVVRAPCSWTASRSLPPGAQWMQTEKASLPSRAGRRRNLHPLQVSRFERRHQCGYCTPGSDHVRQSAARPQPHPPLRSDSPRGNLCRCTGYQQIGLGDSCGEGDEEIAGWRAIKNVSSGTSSTPREWPRGVKGKRITERPGCVFDPAADRRARACPMPKNR